MFKKITTLFLAFCIFTISSSWHTTFADNTEENIQQNKVKYEQLNNEILDLNSKLSAINVEIDELNAKLKDNQAQIEDTENQIKNNKELIKTTEEEIDKNQSILDKRIRSMYKMDLSSNYIFSLLKSKNIFDLISKIQSISRIVSVDKSIIADINSKKDSLNKTIDELNKKQETLISLKKSTEDDLKLVEQKKYEEQEYIDKLESEKDSVFAVIEANESQLVQHPLSIIDSSTSISELESAINTLQGLLPQLNSDYVISLVDDGINNGLYKINTLSTPIEEDSSHASGDNTQTALKTFTMESTAYTGGTLTAMGLKPVRNPDGISTVAVDPSVIPLGSKVYVSGYGVAIASDTGGAINGNIVDVYFNSYDECISWGRRTVTVEILAYPNEW